MGFVSGMRNQMAGSVTAGQMVGGLPKYASGVVHHDALLEGGTVVHHHQTFEGGQLVDWVQDDEPGPWALVRPGDPLSPCPTTVATPEECALVRLRLGDDTLVLPPLDDLPSPDFDALPLIPDATARLRFELTGSPVGIQYCEVRYQDGRRPLAEVVADWPEPAEGEPAYGAPEMHVSMTWRNYLRMRSGRMGALEAIEEGGMVDARWTLLLLLHGLLQSPVYEAAYRALPEVPDELGWWGEVAPLIQPDGVDAAVFS